MQRRDLLLSIAASVVTAIFLLPTLFNTGLYSRLPYPLILLFLGLPILTAVGMHIAHALGRQLALLWQFSKFALVGVLNTAIDFGILNFLIAITGVASGVGIIFMNATSFSTAVVNSYFWNREWVFAGSKKANFPTFFVITLIGLSINTGTVYFLTTFVPHIGGISDELWANIAKVMATFLSLVWNFTGYKLIVFKK